MEQIIFLHSTISPWVFVIIPIVYGLAIGTILSGIYTLVKFNKDVKAKEIFKIFAISFLVGIVFYVFQIIMA